jgi:tyrosinase
VSAAAATASKPPIRHRKNVYLLSQAQRQALRDAFGAVEGISDNRGFQFYAGLHGVPGNFCIHHPPAPAISLFLPWHRAYLYFFELALRDQVPDATLAWWDWSSPRAHTNGVPGLYGQRNVGGNPNPLFRSEIDPSLGGPTETSREPGDPTELPTRQQVRGALAIQRFNRFSSRLEDLHDSVHGWVGGTMGIIAWAAYDPIFWAHHTNIDRLWSLWQLNNHPTFPQSYLDRALPPFPMTVRQTLDVSRLGYDYASSTAHAVRS